MNEKNERILSVFHATNTLIPGIDVVCGVKTTICTDGLRLAFFPKGTDEASIILSYDPYTDYWKVVDFDSMLPNYSHALLRVKYLFKNLVEGERQFGGSGKVFDQILDYLVSPCCPKQDSSRETGEVFGTPEQAS